MTDKAMIERINQRLNELGLTPRAASLKGGGSADMFRLVLSGRSTNPRSDTLQKMANALETTTEWLLNGTDYTETEAEIHVPVADFSPRPPASPSHSTGVPIMGTALGAIVAGRFEGTHIDEPIEYVPTPPGLARVNGIYAVYVAGESMIPAHCPGDLRFASRHRPCAPGDTVIVHTRNHDSDPGQHYIKRLVGRDANAVTLEQFNPTASLTIEHRFIVSIHRVLTVNELFGV
jgi:phage repressor protein C with HTH and peptisase S24 domain